MEIKAGEFVEVTVWTRSTMGAAFTVVDHNNKKTVYIDKVEVKHAGKGEETEMPTCVSLTKERISGPKHIKVKADSHAGRFTCHNFLVVFTFFDK